MNFSRDMQVSIGQAEVIIFYKGKEKIVAKKVNDVQISIIENGFHSKREKSAFVKRSERFNKSQNIDDALYPPRPTTSFRTHFPVSNLTSKQLDRELEEYFKDCIKKDENNAEQLDRELEEYFKKDKNVY